MAQISNDLDRLNGLFDDTINEICHRIRAFTTSDNETYTYLQMLWQDDHKQFFQAMEDEINDHETCNHWTLMLQSDMHVGTRTSWQFGRSSENAFPMVP